MPMEPDAHMQKWNLKILKVMFQMGYGNRIGKEYYITYEAYQNFMKKMAGKEVYI